MISNEKNQTVLITGGSSGIGLELAHLFAKDDATLVLVAQNPKKLNEAAQQLQRSYNVKVHVFATDLSQPQSAQQVVSFLKKKKITIDVLVNNAGFGLFGSFNESDWEKEEAMMNVNMLTLTHLTKLVLPSMIQQKSGKILNIASTAAFMPGPLMAVYYATKAYVLSFSEALANEVKGTGVTVTVLCPGPTTTGFQQVADLGKSKIMQNQSVMSAKEVAQVGFDALQRGQVLAIPGINNQLIPFALRLVPRSIVPGLVRKIQEPKQ